MTQLFLSETLYLRMMDLLVFISKWYTF